MFGERPKHLVLGPDDFPFQDLLNGDPATMVAQITEAIVEEEGTEEKEPTWYTSVVHRSSDIVHARLKNQLESLLATDVALARDIAYFGETRMDMICEAYRLTAVGLAEKLDDQDFTLLVKQFRKDMDKDVNGMLRARAKLMLDAQLDSMHNIVMRGEKDSDRIRAFTAMAQVADAIPRQERGEGAPSGAAANIVFNFGDKSPFKAALRNAQQNTVTVDMEPFDG